MVKKRILIVLDGLADLPDSRLRKKTPLEAASTPNLDKIASRSRLGYCYTIKEGISPESDSSTLAILGYDPLKSYTGRGPLEAAGTEVRLGKNFLALRANFATIKGNKVIDRRVGRGLSTKEANLLSSSINKLVKLPYNFTFLPTIQHRGILVIHKKLSDSISNLDPGYVRHGRLGIAVDSSKLIPCHSLDSSKSSILSSKIINLFSHQSSLVLASHKVNKLRIKSKKLPANFILLRDAGNKLPNLRKKNDRWLAIAGMPLEIGLAKLAGMHVVDFSLPEFSKGNITKSIFANLDKTISVAISSIKKHYKNYDSFYIHIKETDIPGHDGNAILKKKIIEHVDSKLFSFISRLNNAKILVTADHSTPCSLKRHSYHPVPVMLSGSGSDDIPRYTEKLSKQGSLGKLYGKNLLKLLYS